MGGTPLIVRLWAFSKPSCADPPPAGRSTSVDGSGLCCPKRSLPSLRVQAGRGQIAAGQQCAMRPCARQGTGKARGKRRGTACELVALAACVRRSVGRSRAPAPPRAVRQATTACPAPLPPHPLPQPLAPPGAAAAVWAQRLLLPLLLPRLLPLPFLLPPHRWSRWAGWWAARRSTGRSCSQRSCRLYRPGQAVRAPGGGCGRRRHYSRWNRIWDGRRGHLGSSVSSDPALSCRDARVCVATLPSLVGSVVAYSRRGYQFAEVLIDVQLDC